MMKTRLNGTERPKKDAGGLRHGLLVLAVLLLTCVLMAGAVSATEGEVTVNNYNDLVANLSDASVEKIILGSDIDASAEISVNRTVTIDGEYHTISAKPGRSQENGQKNLLVIESGTSGVPTVTLENIFFEGYGNATAGALWYADSSNRDALKPYMGAHGIQVYNTGTTQMQLKNIKINGSQGSGITVNGANVSLVNVTVEDSVWQSVDVAQGDGVTNEAVLTIDANTDLLDAVQINVDNPKTTDATVKLPDGTSYKPYLFSYNSDGTYGEKKLVWSTGVNAAAEKIAESKDVTFNATVQNTGDPLAYHADFSEAMDAAEDGATVTQLEELTLTEPITIDKAITFDGNEKEITVGKMTNSAAALTVTETAAGTTLKNLNMTASSDSETGATMQGMVNLLAKTTIQGGTLDMSDMSLPVDGTYGSNPTVVCIAGENNDGTTISGVTMSAPKRNSPEDSGGVNSNTFCVFINPAKNVKLDGNTFNLGGTAKRSVGVEVRGGSTGTVINDNTINAPENVEYVRAVQIFTNGNADESLTITNNELTGSYKAAVNAVLTSDTSKRADNPTLPVTIERNTIPNAEAGITISGTSEEVTLKVTGTVEAADFSGLSQDQIISGTGVDVTDVDFDPQPQPTYSSSSGNMNNAYRVLFNDGATTLSVQTDLSSGDKLTKPETPVKDGYTFAGWYKDSACTQGWDFETGISGDMTLYAKWTAAGSSGETEATTTPTKTQTAVTTPQPTKTQTAAATTSAPEATTAAGVSPTLTQAPAPVAGALFGLLAAGVLLRRRFQ